MKSLVPILFVALAFLAGTWVSAAKSEVRRHSVVGMLTVRDGKAAKFLVNPTSPSRYFLHVQNPDLVSRLFNSKNFSGLVRAEMDVFPKFEERQPVNILRVQPVHVRRVPMYDENLKAVASGNG